MGNFAFHFTIFEPYTRYSLL